MNTVITDNIVDLVHKFTINTLQEINDEMLEAIKKSQMFDDIEAAQIWGDTEWFKIISNKIKELHK